MAFFMSALPAQTSRLCVAVRLDAQNVHVRVSDGDVVGRRPVSDLGLVDRVDSNHVAPRAWNDPVTQVSVDAQQNVSGHLSDRHHVSGFLKLEHLLVNEHGFVVDNDVWVGRTLIFFSVRLLSALTRFGRLDGAKR
ncbi:hypothetical protein OGATHE_006307 [Ogataea polymorpha]|uniref:Uncharacterized protein n=1 Tax=Ogataea polymorpha TaxID=460523 RepID=A0A9P8NRS6_9ASCO|nr:hypothetical protein OGATHE_006307 [Ogataea polymorpha]